MHGTVRHATVLAVVTALTALAASAHAASPAQVISALDEQRTQHGIPAGIAESSEWSHDCALHNSYMARNHVLSHQEDPNSPGYTDAGNWAGTHAVLAVGVPKGPNFHSPATNPYLDAPYHLAQLLNPSLSVMGVDESQGYDCETTFSGYSRPHPATDRLYGYPGPGAKIPWLEKADELPSVPGDAVGLPEGTTTGPNLIVYWDGPQSPAPLTDVSAATLTGANGGQVDTRVVDDRNGSAFGGTGFVIPVKPLKPGSGYTLKVTFSAPQGAQPRSFTDSWKFTTTTLRTGRKAVALVVSKTGSNVRVSSRALDPVYKERHATLAADYGNSFKVKPFRVDVGLGYGVVPRPSHGRKLKLTYRVAGFKAGGTRVKGFKLTKTIRG